MNCWLINGAICITETLLQRKYDGVWSECLDLVAHYLTTWAPLLEKLSRSIESVHSNNRFDSLCMHRSTDGTSNYQICGMTTVWLRCDYIAKMYYYFRENARRPLLGLYTLCCRSNYHNDLLKDILDPEFLLSVRTIEMERETCFHREFNMSLWFSAIT